MSRSRQLSVRVPWAILDSIEKVHNRGRADQTSSSITCALRVMALLGLDCEVNRRIGELSLAEQDVIDDLYASVTGKLPPFALFNAVLAHLEIGNYDPASHPDQAEQIVRLLLKLGYKLAAGDDVLEFLGLADIGAGIAS